MQPVASTASIRDLNRSAILRLIARHAPIARAEIARRLGVSPATVTAVTRDLIEQGFVEVVDRAPSRGGRPALLLDIVGSAAHALGVKIAADHIVGVRVNLDADVVERFEHAFDAAAPDALERLVELLRPYVESTDEELSPLLGIGLGVPGIVQNDGDATLTAPMLGWKDLPAGQLLQHSFHVPILVDNDVNTLAVAERLYGRGRDFENFITLTIGRGVGLGIVINGDVHRGRLGGAGEFGHVVIDPTGPRCECGRQGCLEVFVGDPALCEQGRKLGLIRKRDQIEALRKLADQGDSAAQEIYKQAGDTLGRALAGVVNVLSPELVLVSGEGTQAWRHISEAFDRSLRDAIFPPLRALPVEVDPWDDAKWARGAAALVLRGTFVPAFGESGSDQESRLGRARPVPIGSKEVVA